MREYNPFSPHKTEETHKTHELLYEFRSLFLSSHMVHVSAIARKAVGSFD